MQTAKAVADNSGKIDLIKVWELACKSPKYQKYYLLNRRHQEAILIKPEKYLYFSFDGLSLCFESIKYSISEEQRDKLVKCYHEDNNFTGTKQDESILLEEFPELKNE